MSTLSFASATLDRREVVAQLIQRVPNVLAVAGLGSSTYDLFAAGDRDRNFYLWGAMGGATMRRTASSLSARLGCFPF